MEKNKMPENKKLTVAVYTLGCRVNQYESKAISEYLEARGASIRDFSEKCDAYIINTCAVTAESERKSRQMARRAFKLNPEAFIVMTGCQAQLHPETAKTLPGVRYVCGNGSKLDAARAVLGELLIDGENTVCSVGDILPEYENYSVNHPDHTRAYIKIEDGCENKCAYCVIPKVRGPVRSKPFESVVDEVRAVAALGYKEIVLTGIETCSYQYGLTELMRTLCEVDGIERIRLGSVAPAYINKKFAEAIKDLPKICPHYHLSLQSCCDKTLNAMKRKYNTGMLFENCEALRDNIKNLCFTADIICGFPGETDEDFEITRANVAKLGLLHAHVFPYSKRPGTVAATMPNQVDDSVKAKRCEILFSDVNANKKKIISDFSLNKTVFSVLFETKSNGTYFGHTENFIPVALEHDTDIREKIVKVRLDGICEINGEIYAKGIAL